MKFKFDVDLSSENKLVNFYTRIVLNAVIFLFSFGWLIPSLISGPGASFIFGLIILLLMPLVFYKLNEKEADKYLKDLFPNWFEETKTTNTNTNTNTETK